MPVGGLTGRTVVVTRAAAQAAELIRLLEARGAVAACFPTIALTEPENWDEVDRAIGSRGMYTGMILTSPNAVRILFDRARQLGVAPSDFGALPVYVVGAKTARALTEYGLSPAAVPGDFRAEGLIDLLRRQGVAGARFLLPRAGEAREILPEAIREMGGEVDVVTLYRTVRAETDPAQLERLEAAGGIDAVVFTSGSTFRHFVGILGPGRAAQVLAASAVACIGPVAAAEVREAGHEVAIVPGKASVEELVAALEEHFSNDKRTKEAKA
jgi:uroporphyrinogen III methyltransferase/synthase